MIAKKGFLSIKKTRNGKGIFSNHKVKKNTIVFEVLGKLYNFEILDTIGGKIQDNSFRFNGDSYLSPEGKIGDYLNHSCNPNSYVKKKRNGLFVVSLFEIKAGSEVTIDYSTILGPDDSWIMKCNCGDSNYRRIIKKFTSLDKKLLLHYKNLKIIPQFLLKLAK